jgi:PASTA domain
VRRSTFALIAVLVACSGGAATGVARARMPNLVDVPTERALDRLAAARLCVARVESPYKAGDGEVVVEQSPKPGTSLAEHAGVSLVLSLPGRRRTRSRYELPGCSSDTQLSVTPTRSTWEGGVCVYEERGPNGTIETCGAPLTDAP